MADSHDSSGSLPTHDLGPESSELAPSHPDTQRSADPMTTISRRRFLQLSAATGGALMLGDLAGQVLGLTPRTRMAYAAEPIKVGIIDPLSSPYKTSSGYKGGWEQAH